MVFGQRSYPYYFVAHGEEGHIGMISID
ncbi:hypothetical protein CCP3SC1_470006 [Gammaproteobacteria bacterium]